MKIVSIDQMRELEAAAVGRGIPLDRLMENAGLKIAQRASELLGGRPKGEHVTVLVGPGNNGGDGMVAARHLDDWGARVHVVLCAPRPEPDGKLESLRDHAVDVVSLEAANGPSALIRALGSSRLVIDAVLGASHTRRGIGGTVRLALEQLQAARARRRDLLVLAVDVPSGLDADTGACDIATPTADLTVTLGFPKAGLFQFPGAARVGRLEIADIGLPQDLAAHIELELSSRDWVSSVLPSRPPHANKGTFGSVMVVAGSARYIGAAALACAGAVRAGAGKVTLATPKSLVPVIAPMLPEITYVPLEETDWGVVKGTDGAKQIFQELPTYDALLVGCGLGQGPSATEMVQQLLFNLPATLSLRVVLDADGLNILARTPKWWQRIQADTVVTPHPGEMRRLTDKTVEDIQGNRLDTAKEAAMAWRKTVLLKGAYSVIATAEGRLRINPFANPALATAGTGDVLAGIIAALVGQGLPSGHAAAAGAFIHAEAAEMARADLGDSGLAASDLPPLVPKAMKRLREGDSRQMETEARFRDSYQMGTQGHTQSGWAQAEKAPEG